MQIGLGVLQIPPNDFWSMSLSEFYAAIEGYNRVNGSGNAPLSRYELERLMERYPD